MIDLRHPLAVLSSRMPWQEIEARVAQVFSPRCHLKGEIGDRLHAVLCAAGYNIRWLLRMIVKKGVAFLGSLFCTCLGMRMRNACVVRREACGNSSADWRN